MRGNLCDTVTDTGRQTVDTDPARRTVPVVTVPTPPRCFGTGMHGRTIWCTFTHHRRSRGAAIYDSADCSAEAGDDPAEALAV
jgi:hypothetical protein